MHEQNDCYFFSIQKVPAAASSQWPQQTESEGGDVADDMLDPENNDGHA